MTPLDRGGRGDDCVSDLRFDRMLAGEMDAAGAAEVRQHASGCVVCAARLREIEVDAAPLPSLPVRARAPRAPWFRRAFALPAFGLAAAAAVILLLVMRGDGDGDDGGTRLKGRAHLSLFVSHGGEVRPAGPGDVVAPGDQLQLTYSAAQATYLAVLSVDGARQASVYFPDDATRAWRAEPGADVPLPRSTVLDEVLGRETLYLLTCDQAVELAPLLATLSAGRPPAAHGCSIETVELEKRAP
ncbi:MAG TPA: hypothetical protein VMZ28_02685 [Kofleriaceae bacterium]|nr:hypothetical protein [Kofleriaceae bacterium]